VQAAPSDDVAGVTIAASCEIGVGGTGALGTAVGAPHATISVNSGARRTVEI
jgi:hypothetical protein